MAVISDDIRKMTANILPKGTQQMEGKIRNRVMDTGNNYISEEKGGEELL